MRKNRIPFGWPRYDPHHYRFTVPNKIWEHKLKPSEFVIFSCLCYYASHGQTTKPTQEMIVESVHLSADTVKKYLSSLINIEDRRTHTCHPSYNTIAAATGMAKNTVMKGIDVLLEMSLITMEHSRYFDKRGMKWKGNNLYTILPVSAAMDVFLQRQLDQLTLDAERRLVRKQQEEYRRRCPRMALCAMATAQTTPVPSQLPEPPYSP